jgi:NodT family efflux transporter outer membrane factor (OMF) lipoprotein
LPVLALALFSACTVGPDFHRPQPWWHPDTWTTGGKPPTAASRPVTASVDVAWWALFQDPLLSSLEQRLAEANLDVRVASIRLAEARIAVGVTAAAGLPSVGANTSYTREQASGRGTLALTPPSSAATTANGLAYPQNGAQAKNSSMFAPYDLYQWGFDASWELDLWGKVRRSVESAQASLAASADTRREVLLTAMAELARDYIALRGTQRSLQITRDNLGIARQSLQLTRERAAGGLTTDLDVANAAAQVATVAAQLPGLEARETQLTNAIGLLLGAPPAALQHELASAEPVPPVPAAVPVGLPAELLRRRPDIRRAEAELHAATANIGVAVADFFPQVTLSGSVAIQGLQFRNLTDWGHANTYAFGPSLSLPIFEGGKLTRVLELRKEQQKEAAVLYQRSVLGALHEVDDALTQYDAEQHRRDALRQAVAENRRALGLARARYSEGVVDFLQVLDVERNLLAAEQQLADSTTAVSTDLVQIYKALGGGWQTAFPADTQAAVVPAATKS